MDIRDMDSRHVAGGILLFATITTGSTPAVAGEWQVTPSLTGEEKWTDNVYNTADNRKADLVTTLQPGIAISGEGAGVKAAMEYDLSYDLYASQTGLNGFRHNAMGLANAAVIDDLLYMDVRGSLNEESVNPIGAGAGDDRTAASNRVRVASYSAAPSLRHRFGSWGTGTAFYRHDETRYMATDTSSDPGTGTADSIGDSAKVEVQSGESFDRMLWDVGAETARVNRSSQIFTETSGTVRNETKVIRELGILAHVGHDTLHDTNLDSAKYSGVFYGGGLHWGPSPDTDVRGEVGYRYGGLDLSALASHHIGAFTTLRASHDTKVTTEGETFADALQAVERDASGQFIDPFSGMRANPTASPFARTSSLFKMHNTQAAVNFAQGRDSITLSTGLDSRKGLSTNPTDADAGSTALTLALIYEHDLTERLKGIIAIAGDDIIQSDSALGKGRQLRTAFDLAYAINPSLAARAGYRYVDTKSEQSASITENVVMMGVRKSF
jgi:uncharacterized protein (PEP-CTERM system associated)